MWYPEISGWVTPSFCFYRRSRFLTVCVLDRMTDTRVLRIYYLCKSTPQFAKWHHEQQSSGRTWMWEWSPQLYLYYKHNSPFCADISPSPLRSYLPPYVLNSGSVTRPMTSCCLLYVTLIVFFGVFFFFFLMSVLQLWFCVPSYITFSSFQVKKFKTEEWNKSNGGIISVSHLQTVNTGAIKRCLCPRLPKTLLIKQTGGVILSRILWGTTFNLCWEKICPFNKHVA